MARKDQAAPDAAHAKEEKQAAKSTGKKKQKPKNAPVDQAEKDYKELRKQVDLDCGDKELNDMFEGMVEALKERYEAHGRHIPENELRTIMIIQKGFKKLYGHVNSNEVRIKKLEPKKSKSTTKK